MKNKQLRNKIFKTSLAATTIGSALAGVVFGIVAYSSNSEIFKTSNEYQNKYETQVSVDWGPNDSNIDYVTSSIYERLDFYGYENAEINIINDSTLSITTPVSAFDKKTDDKWSVLTEEELTKEILTFQTAITQKQNIEFRHHDGAQLFDIEDGQIRFIEPEEPEEPEPDYINTDSNDFYDKYEIQLFSDARISYNNGIPYVELKPANENILEEFRQLGRILPGHYDPENNPQGNMVFVWFGYEELIWRAEATDFDQFSQAGFDPLIYAFTNSLGEPTSTVRKEVESNFITSWEITGEFSIHEDWISIYGSFTQQQALNTVASIKFANRNFDLDVIATNLIINEETLIANAWLIWVFLAIILLAAFFMVFWSGLLGLIASTSTGVIVLSMLGFVLAMGIPLTSAIISTIALLAMISMFINYFIVKIVKSTIGKPETPNSKFKTHLKLTSKTTSIAYAIIIIFLSSIVFFLPANIGVIMFMLLLGLLLFLPMIYGLIIPSFFGLDLLFNFSSTKESDWDLVKGYSSFKTVDTKKTISKVSSPFLVKNVLIAASAITVIGFSVFGIMNIYGSGVNGIHPAVDYYQYDIVLTERWGEDDIEDIPSDREDDPYNQEQMIKTAKTDSIDIVSLLKEKQVSVTSTSIIRNDNHFLWKLLDPDGINEDVFDYDFSYGISVYSSTELTEELVDEIDLELSNIGDGYEFAMQSSLSDIENVSKYNQYTRDRGISAMSWGMFGTLLITTVFIIAYFKWSTAASIFSSIISESAMAFALTIIFWTPWTSMFWIGLLIVIGFSLITKIIGSTYVKQRMLTTKRNTEEDVYSFFKEYSYKSSIPTILGASIIMLFAVCMAMVMGGVSIGMLSVLGFGLVLVIGNNIFTYPKMASTIYSLRKNINDRKLMQDEQKSLDPKNIEEEYIKGINK